MRLQKFLANCGVASRRKSEEIISDGRVMVNGELITEMGFKVNPDTDEVYVDNKKIALEKENIYVVLNKPTGYVTTVLDQFNRKKVVDLVDVPYRIFPVGRLDYDTSGLLILTNDGEFTYKATHPKFEIEKVYIAKVKGIPNEQELKDFEKGLSIDDYITAPSKIKIINQANTYSTLEIAITEGRNRQVRKMCDAIGHPVLELERISMGEIHLNNLKIGQWRYFTKNEIDYLKRL